MLWLYIDFYALQLDALLLTQDAKVRHEDSEPDVLVLVNAKTNRVVQLNDVALKHGLKTGMGIATAVSLHHDVQVMEYQPERERDKLKQIAQLLYDYTADIALAPPQGLHLRIDNMFRLYGGLENYWQSLSNTLSSLGYRFRYATGTTPLMSKLLAQQGFNQLLDQPKQLKQALAQLHIEQLEIDQKTAETLNRVGIKKLQQLIQLPMKELARRFDIQVLNYIGKMLGELKHGLQFYTPPPYFSADLELMFEISNTQVLQHPLKKLLAQLETFLQMRNLVTQQINVHLFYRHQESITVSLSRASGEYKQEKWLALLQLKLESVKLTEPVVSVQLQAKVLQPMTTGSQSLFGQKQPNISQEELISMLQAKVGEQKVFSLLANDQHNPAWVTAYQSAEHVSSNSSNLLSKEHIKPRPSLQLAEPILLKDKVTILQGPERLQTAWWQQAMIQRDYYVARSHDGKLCWIFKTPQKQWFIQGYFA